MRIKTVKWKEHPVLGNLELDFTKNNSPFDIYSTILLVGENGTGKTTIFETLSSFLNAGSFAPFDFIEYKIEGNLYKAIRATDGLDSYFQIMHPDARVDIVRSDKNNQPQEIQKNRIDPRHYEIVFSKAQSIFVANQITSTTTTQLDEPLDTSDNDPTRLKQLVINVFNQDGANCLAQMQVNPRQCFKGETFLPTTKISRFTNAYKNFFEEKIAFKSIESNKRSIDVIFQKNEKDVEMDGLSTGEKQIIYRGIDLLKNKRIFEGGSIFIDEPELSLHPKWQDRILEYYQDLCKNFDQDAHQQTQLFIATHSERILKKALENLEENLIIILKEEDGIISATRVDSPFILPTLTAAEVSYVVFDIVSIDFHIALYGEIQSKFQKNKIKDCDQFILDYILTKVPSNKQSQYIKKSSNNHSGTNYDTLPTYIRNAIHHPDNGSKYNDEDLRQSVQLMIEIIKNTP